MNATLAAEFKKIFTVRSTYILSIGFFLLTVFLAFYIQGFKNSDDVVAAAPGANLFLAGTITQIANVIQLAGTFIALLLLGHEYRYNTIIHTILASNSRSKVLASKIIAILTYVFFYSAAVTVIALWLMWAGVAANGHHLPHQHINYLTYVIKSVVFSEAYAMAGLLIVALIRNLIGSFIVLLVVPNTIEGLLSLLLKQHSIYMPFTALQEVVQPPVVNGLSIGAHGARDASINTGHLSPVHGALVYLAYLVVVWAIAWYLFLKRDAA